MLVLSTDVLPDGYSLDGLFGLVEITQPIQVSQKSLIGRFLDGHSNPHDEALIALQRAAKEVSGGEANIVYGVKVSTAIGSFNNGTFLYLTYIGTAAKATW